MEIEIGHYVAWLQKEKRDYRDAKAVPVSAIITAIAQDETLAGRPNKFYFVFVDSEKIPNDYLAGREVFAFRKASHYSCYIDLLRNEKPIKVVFDRDTGSVQLATGRREPVGEGPGEHKGI